MEDRLQEFINQTKREAYEAIQRPQPRLPWHLRFRCWVDREVEGSVDIWEVIAIVLLVRLIFG